MVPLTALWLAILLSAVFVFVASSIIHMLLPDHRSDYRQLPDEDRILAALRPARLKRALYVFPFGTHQDMKSPVQMEKQKQGPVGCMTAAPHGPPAMPKFLIQWFVFCLPIGFFVAYLTGHSVASGANDREGFRVAGTAAFLIYGLGQLSSGIWKCRTRSSTIKEVLDGLVYGLLTASTFGWLWPR
jgi:hypothetical protein